jgi:hypothetical protein
MGIPDGNFTTNSNDIEVTPTLGMLLAVTQQELTEAYQIQAVHLRAIRIVSEALGHPYKGITGKTCIDLAELAAKVIRGEVPNPAAKG